MLKSQPGTPRLCLPTGEWSGEPASCKVKTCRYTEVTGQTAAGSRHAGRQRLQVRQLQGQDMHVHREYRLDSCRVKTCRQIEVTCQTAAGSRHAACMMQVHRGDRLDSCRVKTCRQTEVTGQTTAGSKHAGRQRLQVRHLQGQDMQVDRGYRLDSYRVKTCRYTEVQLCMFSKLLNCHIKTCKDTDFNA